MKSELHPKENPAATGIRPLSARASLKRRLRRVLGNFARRSGLTETWPFRLYERYRMLRVELTHAGPKDGRMHPSPRAEQTMHLIGPRQAPAFEPVRGRVVYVLHNSLPYSSGGYATRTQGFATALSAANLDIAALTRPGFPLDTKTELVGKPLAATDTVGPVTYHRLFDPARTELSGQHYIAQAADAVEGAVRELKPELVMAASNHVAAMPALIAARRLGLPFIYEVRGFWEVTRLSRQPSFAKWQSYRDLVLLEAAVCKHADWIFTLTGAMRDELVARGSDRARITLLPNSCNIEDFVPRGRAIALAERLGIADDVPIIGYIGTFVDYEGLDDLVRACGVLRQRGLDFRLLLVGNENTSGSGTGPITALIKKTAARTGLADRLIMPGRVPHDEVQDYYSLVDIVTFPRKPWPVCEMVSPIKPLEAMALEKAVIVSSVNALKEMVIDGRTGLVYEKGNDLELVAALERLLRDPELRRRLGQSARNWVSENRTWAKTAATAIAVMESQGLVRIAD